MGLDVLGRYGFMSLSIRLLRVLTGFSGVLGGASYFCCSAMILSFSYVCRRSGILLGEITVLVVTL